MTTYRDMALPQLNHLKALREGFDRSHPVYGCAQVISHLAYRGPHEKVGWWAKTSRSALNWAHELGIVDGIALPTAMGSALDAIGHELRQVRGSVADDLVDEMESVVTELRNAMGIEGSAGTIQKVVEWPSIEWVRVPVDPGTGLPSGAPIAMRHFADCIHCSQDDDGTWIGDPPLLASDEQMDVLPACEECAARAERSGNERTGARLGCNETNEVPDAPTALVLDFDGTDVTAIVRARREQSYLRKNLFAASSVAVCALCGRTLPVSLLVAAHIVPRRLLDDAERLDFASAAMIACALGCDALFERGYVVVRDDGTVASGRPAVGSLKEAVEAVTGRSCSAFNPKTAAGFQRHANLHTSWSAAL